MNVCMCQHVSLKRQEFHQKYIKKISFYDKKKNTINIKKVLKTIINIFKKHINIKVKSSFIPLYTWQPPYDKQECKLTKNIYIL